MKKSKKKSMKEKAILTSEFKMVDMVDFPTRGREVFIRATVDALRGDKIICRNKHGYCYTVAPSEVYVRPTSRWIQKGRKFECSNCGNEERETKWFCSSCGSLMAADPGKPVWLPDPLDLPKKPETKNDERKVTDQRCGICEWFDEKPLKQEGLGKCKKKDGLVTGDFSLCRTAQFEPKKRRR